MYRGKKWRSNRRIFFTTPDIEHIIGLWSNTDPPPIAFANIGYSNYLHVAVFNPYGRITRAEWWRERYITLCGKECMVFNPGELRSVLNTYQSGFGACRGCVISLTNRYMPKFLNRQGEWFDV